VEVAAERVAQVVEGEALEAAKVLAGKTTAANGSKADNAA
jgi:hypothetical protein